jgi:hypothetical protein
MEKQYKVVLNPKSGTIGGTISTSISASDKAKAQKLAEAQYGSKYRVSVQG